MKKKLSKLSGAKKSLIALVAALFFPAVASVSSAASEKWDPSNYSAYGLPEGSIYSIILGIMKWMLVIFGFIAIIGFVISGIMYLTSTGDDDRQEKAKNQMYWSITGVIVGLLGYIVIYAATEMLGGANSQF